MCTSIHRGERMCSSCVEYVYFCRYLQDFLQFVCLPLSQVLLRGVYLPVVLVHCVLSHSTPLLSIPQHLMDTHSLMFTSFVNHRGKLYFTWRSLSKVFKHMAWFIDEMRPEKDLTDMIMFNSLPHSIKLIVCYSADESMLVKLVLVAFNPDSSPRAKTIWECLKRSSAASGQSCNPTCLLLLYSLILDILLGNECVLYNRGNTLQQLDSRLCQKKSKSFSC